MVRTIGIATLIAAAMGLGLRAQAQEKSSGTLVPAEELKKMVEPALLISGRVVVAGEWFSQLFQRGGIAHFIYSNDQGGGGYTKRKWRLEGDTFCIDDTVLGERCYHFYLLADGGFEGRGMPGEELRITFRIINQK